MKKTLAALAILAALTLTGCTAAGEVTPEDAFVSVQGTEALVRAVTITTENGRVVDCAVMIGHNYRAGLTCDWDGAK